MAEKINNSLKTMNHGITKFMVLNVSKKDHKMLMAFFCLPALFGSQFNTKWSTLLEYSAYPNPNNLPK